MAPPLLSTTPVCQRSCSHACRYRLLDAVAEQTLGVRTCISGRATLVSFQAAEHCMLHGSSPACRTTLFPLDSTEQHRRRPCGPGGVWSIASPGSQLLLTVAGWLVGQSAASNRKFLSRLNAKGAQASASAALYLGGSPPSLRASERSRHGAAEHCEPSEFLASRDEVGILHKPEPSLARMCSYPGTQAVLCRPACVQCA